MPTGSWAVVSICGPVTAPYRTDRDDAEARRIAQARPDRGGRLGVEVDTTVARHPQTAIAIDEGVAAADEAVRGGQRLDGSTVEGQAVDAACERGPDRTLSWQGDTGEFTVVP